MNRHAVGSGIDHLLRHHQVVGRKISGDGLRRHFAAGGAQLDHGARGTFGIAAEISEAAADQHGRPFRCGAACHCDRRMPSGAIYTPDVTAVDIQRVGCRLVRRVNNLACILRVGDVLHLELAGREQGRSATLDRGRIEMRPPIAFPRKDNAICPGPYQLIFGDHRAKHAARTGVRLPDLPACTVGDTRHADSPRVSRAPSAASAASTAGHAREGHLFAVGRPRGVGIAIHAGVQVAQRLRREIVDRDEAVIGAVADVREFGAVRRPANLARGDTGARVNQQRRPAPAGKRRHENLSAGQVGQPVALRRHHRRVSRSDLARRFTGSGDPNGLIDAGRVCRRVGVGPSQKFQVAAAHVDHSLAVRRPAELAHILPVVLRVVGEAHAFEIGCRGHPHVARAALIEQPRHLAAARRDDQFGGKWR